jgi:hypothetical protein
VEDIESVAEDKEISQEHPASRDGTLSDFMLKLMIYLRLRNRQTLESGMKSFLGSFVFLHFFDELLLLHRASLLHTVTAEI